MLRPRLRYLILFLSRTSSELCFRKRSNLLQLLSERNRNELRILPPLGDIH